MHAFIGVPKDALPADVETHHIVVNDWSLGVDAPGNVILISIPSVLDESLAPEGYHCIHAYTPGTSTLRNARRSLVWEIGGMYSLFPFGLHYPASFHTRSQATSHMSSGRDSIDAARTTRTSRPHEEKFCGTP